MSSRSHQKIPVLTSEWPAILQPRAVEKRSLPCQLRDQLAPEPGLVRPCDELRRAPMGRAIRARRYPGVHPSPSAPKPSPLAQSGLLSSPTRGEVNRRRHLASSDGGRRGTLYLSPCGRGYEGRVSFANPWPKLVRGDPALLSTYQGTFWPWTWSRCRLINTTSPALHRWACAQVPDRGRRRCG